MVKAPFLSESLKNLSRELRPIVCHELLGNPMLAEDLLHGLHSGGCCGVVREFSNDGEFTVIVSSNEVVRVVECEEVGSKDFPWVFENLVGQ